MTKKLAMKRCPFCKGKAVRNKLFPEGARFWNCGNDGCPLSNRNYRSGIHFLIWNHRPEEDRLLEKYGVKESEITEADVVEVPT